MQKSEKQYTIYIRSTKESIPVSKKEFDDYYRDINAYRRTQMNHGKCVCPSSKWLSCDMDCVTCPFSRAGDSRSLDMPHISDDGTETPWVDDIPTDAPLLEEIVTNAAEMKELYARLSELMPEAVTIGQLRLDGVKDVDIAQIIGIKNTTFVMRLKKARSILEKEFPEIFKNL